MFIASQYDDMLKLNQETKKSIDSMQNDLKMLKAQITAKDAIITQLSNRVNELEQETCSKSVEIHGVVIQNNEDVSKIPLVLAEKLGSQVNFADTVESIYCKNKGRGDNPPPIVVEFKSKALKQEFMTLKKRLFEKKSSNASIFGGQDKERKKLIFDQLTPFYKNLLYKTKMAAREKTWKFVWTANGNILARKNETLGTIRVKNEDDIISKIV